MKGMSIIMKQKIKKLLAMFLIGVIVFSILTGCNTTKQSTSKNGKITITLGMHVADTQKQEPVTWNIVQEFMKRNPDIIVKIQGSDKDTHVQNMKIAAQAGELPDIFWMDSSVAPQLNKAGDLLDLNDFLNKYPNVSAALNDNMKKAFNSDGVQYGLPYQALVTGIWYNKSIFEKNGLKFPTNGTTYEELLNDVRVLKSKGIVPIVQGAKDPYSVWAFLIALERYGYFEKIDDILAGKAKFNNPDFVKFFDKLVELGKNGAFPSNASTMTYFQAKEEFLAGRAAMFDSGMWDAAAIDEKLGENVGFWWGPTFSDSSYNQKVKMDVPSAPLCVSAKVGKDRIKKDAVYKFLAFYYGPEAAKISYAGSVIPATNYKVDVDMSGKYAFKQLVEALQDPTWKSPMAQPDLVLDQAVQAQLYDSMYGAMLGLYTTNQALDKLDAILKQQ